MSAEYFDSAEVSDVGRKRKNNEDAYIRIPAKGIFCVADGMGGQAGGDLASEAITTNLQQTFTKAAPDEDSTLPRRMALFRKAINHASKWIKNFADEKVIGQMGSTVVALIIDPRNPARAAALHAGDSRLYRYRKGELIQITADHSAVTALATKLGVSPDKIPAKYQNELLRAVGLTEAVELEKTPVDIISGDVYLLCSDGLDKMQTNDQIAQILKNGASQPLATVAQNLINAANEAGGRDNVTVMLVKAGDLSQAPKFIDPNEEEEEKTFAAPTPPTPPTTSEALTPSNYTPQVPAMPDTADVHGDTPSTPSGKNITADKVTADKVTTDKPPTPLPAPTPSPTPAQVSIPDTKKGPEISGANIEAKPEPKIYFPLGIVITIALLLVAGAGIWFGVGSKKKPAVAGNKLPAKPAITNKPVITNSPSTTVATIPAKPAPPTPPITPLPAAASSGIQDAYRDALKNAQAAWDKRDYKNAAAGAAAALQKMPGDATAAKLQSDALAQLKYQEAWREALKNGQTAYGNRDFKNALAWAAEALKQVPNEPTATQLRDNAQQQLAATVAQEQKYQAAAAAAQAALKNNDPSAATKKAQEMLAVRPNDPAAAAILKQSQQLMDLESARRSFDRADYDYALQICQNNLTLAAFKQLAQNCRAEQTTLADAKNRLTTGDYSFAGQLQGQPVARKAPFAELLALAASEEKILSELAALKQANNWQAVTSVLADPANAALANKTPFRALGQWAKSVADQAEGQKQLQQANIIFEEMLVWFNLKRPTDPFIKSTEAKKQFRLDGTLGEENRQRYLTTITWLETLFKKSNQLNQDNRAKLLKDLQETVKHHE